MATTPIRALIFDFDGVILDSNALKTNAFGAVFARFPEHAETMMRYHEANVWQSRYEKFAHLAGKLGRAGDTQLVNELADEFAALLRDGMARCPFVAGARELLESLSPRVPLYLASVTPATELLRLLDVHAIRQHFTQVYGCPPWAKADAVAAIVRALGGAEGVALVGDSTGDQRAALANGVEFIPRLSGLPFDPPVTGTADLAAIGAHIKSRIPA